MKILENIEIIVNKLGYTMREFINESIVLVQNFFQIKLIDFNKKQYPLSLVFVKFNQILDFLF